MKMSKKIMSIVLAGAMIVVLLIVGTLAASVSGFTKIDLLTEAAKSPVYKHIREAVETLADNVMITDEQTDSIMPYITNAVNALKVDRGPTEYGDSGYYSREERNSVMECIDGICNILGWTYSGVPSENPAHYGDIVFNLYNQDGELILSYDGDAAEEPVRAKGIVFKGGYGYTANTYTGYIGGVDFDTTVSNLLASLENSLGVEVRRDKTLDASDTVQHGDKMVVTAEDGTVISELEIIMMGNADKNNDVNLSDVSSVLKKIAKWNVDVDEIAADVDGNGSVNLLDVSTLLQYIAKWDVEFVNTPVLPGTGNSSLSKITQTFVKSTVEQEASPLNLREGQDLAVKFSVEEGKYAKSVKATYPSWSDSKGTIRLSLYKWDTDYETTIASAPIVTEKYNGFTDGAEIIFDLTDTAGKGVGEGEYLWRIHEGFDAKYNPEDKNEGVGIGMWTYSCPAADSGVTVFFEGVALDPAAEGSFGPEAYIQIGN